MNEIETGYLGNYQPVQRNIWVKRDNGQLEFKIWFIYTYELIGIARDTVITFLEAEQARYRGSQPHDLDQLKASAIAYSDLQTTNINLPPRLQSLSEQVLNDLDTELFTDANGFVFGDSVGGTALNKPAAHNAHLKKDLHKYDTILFNPGALARVVYKQDGQNYSIFQLSEKNLRTKGRIFYKPFGGHLKVVAQHYADLLKTYGITSKIDNPHDLYDVSFFVDTRRFDDFITLFSEDTFINETFHFFEDPLLSTNRELLEEIGPVTNPDGINLLSAEDLTKRD